MRILVKTADIFGIIELYFPSFELLCESDQTMMIDFDFMSVRVPKSGVKILLNNFYCIVLPFFNSEISLCGLDFFGNLVYHT